MIFDPFLTPLRINTGGRKVSNHVASIVKLRIGEMLILKAKLLVLDLCDELVFPPRSNITDFRSIANKYVLIMLFLSVFSGVFQRLCGQCKSIALIVNEL